LGLWQIGLVHTSDGAKFKHNWGARAGPGRPIAGARVNLAAQVAETKGGAQFERALARIAKTG